MTALPPPDFEEQPAPGSYKMSEDMSTPMSLRIGGHRGVVAGISGGALVALLLLALVLSRPVCPPAVSASSQVGEGVGALSQDATPSAASSPDQAASNLEPGLGELKDQVERIGAEALPEPDLSVVVDGLPAPMVTPETTAVFEDADTTIMVGDRLGVQADDPQRSADHFRKLANFWRAAQDFPRAVRRLERARELAPAKPQVLLDLAITLAEWAKDKGEVGAAQGRRLERALGLLAEAEGLPGVDLPHLLFNRAWIFDEMAQPGAAVVSLREAQKEEESAAKKGNRQPRSSITYNLAAALTKSGDLDAAVTELGRVIHRDKNWESVEQDDDFDGLRSSPLHAEQLREMLKQAREAAAASGSE